MTASTRNDRASRNNVQDLITAIRERVIGGELAPRQRLTEKGLAGEFGVSRIPIREAIRELASEGFVRSERYGGTFVAELNAEIVEDLLDVRAALEPLAAAQAAMRCSRENLARLRELLADAERAARQRRSDQIRTLKGQFFEQLAIASENETLISLMRIVRYKIEWATSVDAIEHVPEGTRRQRAKMMHEIIDAIADGDPARAATAVAASFDASYASQGWRRVVDTRYHAPPASAPRKRRPG